MNRLPHLSRLPTTDIYLRNACAAAIQPWWRIGRSPSPARAARPLRQVAANAFTAGEWLVLIRRSSPAMMRTALDWPGRLAYLVDDDIAGAADSVDLPAPYRQRLARFDHDWHRALLARADVLVVPSAPLAARFAADPAINAAVRRIEPCWDQPFADQAHFAGPARGEPLRIVHLGSGSHRGGLDVLAPALTRLLATHPATELTYVAAPPGLATWAAEPRVRREPPRRWPAYRRWLGCQRFHLALYPLLPTPFDQARSANKLQEHAIVGAVGVYPENWQPGRDLALGQPDAALLAPADPAAWYEALSAAIGRGAQLGEIAAAAQHRLSSCDFAAMQRSLWSDILNITIA